MIDKDNVLLLWTIIVSIAAISIYLESKYELVAKISGAIVALVCAMLLSNLNIIPIDSPVYYNVWAYVVPMAIPLLLFQCNISKIWRESGRLLIIFLISSMGTVVGSIIGYTLLNKYIPSLNHIAGTMTASYIGGGVNFVAVSSSFNIDSKLISAATVSDNLLMVLYFFVLIIIPSIVFFNKNFKREYSNETKMDTESINSLKKTVNLVDIAFSFAFSLLIVTISFSLSSMILGKFGDSDLVKFIGNKYLILTTISVLFASLFPKFFSNISGSQEIGTFFIYIFFVVIGIPASIMSIIQNSPLLLVYCLIMVLVNMIITFVGAKLFNFTLEEAILVSNANIGGPTTATAMAISKGWNKYVAPVMLVGTLGYIIGTYIGIFIGNMLG
ncbi:DUF819 family protein [Streptobacillus canis]|uniref:DUF819 family protein n=1 Tax=Streptobacillus canis TaxID=2678686 RepID=UPI0012E1F047|nr:DUF819 family protein [Streptobacillus canis]